MAKFLRCHTAGFMRDDEGTITGEEFATVGIDYPILSENVDAFIIQDQRGKPHPFSIEPDDIGLSYASWFELVEN